MSRNAWLAAVNRWLAPLVIAIPTGLSMKARAIVSSKPDDWVPTADILVAIRSVDQGLRALIERAAGRISLNLTERKAGRVSSHSPFTTQRRPSPLPMRWT